MVRSKYSLNTKYKCVSFEIQASGLPFFHSTSSLTISIYLLVSLRASRRTPGAGNMSSNMGWLTKRLAVVSLSILCLTPPTTAVPLTTSDESITVARSAAALTDQLRILPLGASITRGEQSNPKDGYRKSLRDKLLQAGWVNINMVGSQ